MRGVDSPWHGEEREAVDFSRRPQEALMSSTEIQTVWLLFLGSPPPERTSPAIAPLLDFTPVVLLEH